MSSPPSQPSSALTSPSLTVSYGSPGTSNRRWSPLSYHGLPRSPQGTFGSVSSPTSIATPSTVVSHHSTRSHRFDALSPVPSAYTAPSYTSSITLAPPPEGKRARLDKGPDHQFPESLPLRSTEEPTEGPAERSAEPPPTESDSFCRRVLIKLGCCGGPRNRRRQAEDVLKIEPVHWTEQ